MIPAPDARTVIEQLPAWLAHYNDAHPHKALGYRSPTAFDEAVAGRSQDATERARPIDRANLSESDAWPVDIQDSKGAEG